MTPSLIKDIAPPCPARFNIAAYVLEGDGASTALEVINGSKSTRWSRADLRAAILGFAGALEACGLRPGARIALRLGDSVDFPIAFFGAMAGGYVPVPLSSMLTATELAPMLDLLRPDLILCGAGLTLPETDTPILHGAVLDHARRTAPRDGFADTAADDLAYVLFTSGSGGQPKAVRHAHRAAWARRMMWQGWYGLRANDRVLHAGAFNWSYTLGTGLIDPWACGATSLLVEGARDARILHDAIRDHGATLFAAVPGVYRRLLKLDRLDLPSLRHGLSAGEALPDPVRSAWRDRTGTDIHEALGMTELSTFLSSSPTRPAPSGTQGYAQPGRTLSVLNEAGDIVSRGTPGQLAIASSDPGLMLGYDGQPLISDGWFVTSDLVEMQADGAIRHLGRVDDVMTAQGYRVAPRDVETALEQHPAIIEAAVAQVEVRPGTHIIIAFLRGDVSAAELSAHCDAHLSRYKRPRHFQLVTDLPRGPTGKLLRRALPDLYDPKANLT